MRHNRNRRSFVRALAKGAFAFANAGALALANRETDQVVGNIPGLDEYCKTAIAEWQVPGIAVAVIKDGELLLARGYGVSDMGSKTPVDENTIFPIASCTKSFAAAMVGRLVDQKKIEWDDPISSHVPGLVVPSSVPGVEPTVRHALQNRTGLPNANMLWRSGEFSAEEILRRVRLLQPVAAPGEKMIYNNVLYMAAGKAAEHVSGRPWNEFVTSEFLKPLGMERSLADSSRVREFANVASPHALIDGEIKAVEGHCPDVIAPAGAVHSTAADLAQWLMMHLNKGRFRGRQILTERTVEQLHKPVEPPPDDAETPVQKSLLSRYAMGWFVNRHAGRDIVEHAGGQNGIMSWMAFEPGQRAGVVVLSNAHRTGINFALRTWILDRLLNQPDKDWSVLLRADYTKGRQKLRDAKAEFAAKRKPDKQNTLRPSEFTGTYVSPLYSSIHVSARYGQLSLKCGTRFHGKMQHWQGNSYRVFFSDPLIHDWLVTFTVADGKVVSLRANDTPWAPKGYDDRDNLGMFARS